MPSLPQANAFDSVSAGARSPPPMPTNGDAWNPCGTTLASNLVGRAEARTHGGCGHAVRHLSQSDFTATGPGVAYRQRVLPRLPVGSGDSGQRRLATGLAGSSATQTPLTLTAP